MLLFNYTSQKIVTAALMLTLLTACGGGSGSNSGNTSEETNGPQITQGAIDGFGSIIVNGIHFETNGAEITVDDLSAAQSDLRIGQMVTIIGEHDGVNGTAQSVNYDALVEGPITNIDVANNQFDVLGQTVIVDGMTVFERTSLTALAVGDVVEVSGSVDANGNIRASFVELDITPSMEHEVRGLVSNVNSSTMTFSINALTVDYSSAAIIEVGGGQIQNGQLVEVKGTLSGATLVATKVEEESVNRQQDSQLKLEGLITVLRLNENEFDLGQTTVRFNPSTQFRRGTQNDLVLNRKVEVEGVLDENGILIAREIEFERNDFVEVEAFVDEVDASANSITLLGLNFTVNNSTRIRDKRDEVINFDISDIMIGDYLEIRAAEDETGSLVATRLEREDDDDDIILQGVVDSIDAANSVLVIQGVSIDFSSTLVAFEDISDLPITRQQFLNSIDIGSIVKAKGSFSGQTLFAIELDIEID